MKAVQDAIEKGIMIDIRTVTTEIQPYARYWGELFVHDGVVLMGNRIAIPQSLQQRVLRSLHSAHQGVTQMYARAEISVFWPGLHTDLEKIRADCVTCRVNAPSNPKLPPHQPPQPDYPFQQICCDYLNLNGVPYLVTVYRMKGWPDVRRAKNNEAGSR